VADNDTNDGPEDVVTVDNFEEFLRGVDVSDVVRPSKKSLKKDDDGTQLIVLDRHLLVRIVIDFVAWIACGIIGLGGFTIVWSAITTDAVMNPWVGLAVGMTIFGILLAMYLRVSILKRIKQ
jgi:hypothetical protein